MDEVQHRPCGDPHDAEVILNVDHAGPSYPTEQGRLNFMRERCLPAFNSCTGRDYQTDPDYDIGWFYPTSSGWTGGDREFTCYVLAVEETKITRSLRAAPSPSAP